MIDIIHILFLFFNKTICYANKQRTSCEKYVIRKLHTFFLSSFAATFQRHDKSILDHTFHGARCKHTKQVSLLIVYRCVAAYLARQYRT